MKPPIKDRNYYLCLLERAWAGICDGSLEHEQRHYFCGTTACLAGWMYALEIDATAKQAKGKYLDAMFGSENYECELQAANYLWDRYADALSLTEAQAVALFNGRSEPGHQQLAIDGLLGPNAPRHPEA